MKVVVIEESAGEYSALGQGLAEAGYAVCIVAAAAAPATFSRDLPDVCVVGCRDGFTNLAPIATLRNTLAASGYRAIVAVVSEPMVAHLEATRGAGADDVVGSSATVAEIVDHVRSCARIVGLERKLRERVAEVEGALRHAADAGPVQGTGPGSAADRDRRGGFRFLLTRTWTAVDDLLRNMCTEYLQSPFEQIAGTFVVAPGCAASSIALTDVENELAMELTFLATPAAARVVAAMFTGDASIVDDEVVKDVLLELANSGMGAVRNGLLGENFRFAASTPKPAPPRAVDKLVAGVAASRMLTFKHGEATLHVVVAVRSQARIKVRGLLLKEGMVIATDILNDAGQLLVRAGTRLTETTAGRIARMVPKLEVELADAA